MAPEADTRRRKKDRARGHVATPALKDGFIPGVPSFEDGGPIITGDIGAATQGPSYPPGYLEWLASQMSGGPVSLESLGYHPLEGFPGWVVGPDDRIAQLPTQDTGAAGPAWRPGELGLQQAQLAIRQAEFELDQAISTGDLALRERAQDALDAARARADMIELRGQNITQRGQDIQAELQMLQLVQSEADSLRRDAMARGDFELAAQAEQRERVALGLMSALEARAQDITLRGQDLTAEAELNSLRANVWRWGNEAAIASGNLQLAQQTEQRMRVAQQQQVVFDQHRAALEASGLGISAQQGAATQGTQLAMGLGNIEARRAEFLSGLAANPRDFMQMQFALGGGQNILNQLMQGQPFQGQSVARAGQTPMLGAGHQQLVDAVTQRRDLPYFEEARGYTRDLAGMARSVPRAPSLAYLQQLGQLPPLAPAPTMAPRPEFAPPNLPGVAPIPGIEGLLGGLGPLPQLPAPIQSPDLTYTPPQFAKGGSLVTDEPIVGIGQHSGLPRFTVGEGGKPEMMEVTPMRTGGTVRSEPIGRTHPLPKRDKPELPAAQVPIGTTDPVRPPTQPILPIVDMPRPVQPTRIGPEGIPGTGPRPIALPMPNIPGAALPPGTALPMINPLPPRTGELGEFIVTGDGSAFLNNPGHAERALRQAEALGGHGPQFDWLKNLVAVQAQTREAVTPAMFRAIGPAVAARRNAAAAPTPAAPETGGMAPGEVVRNFMQSITPDRYYSMMPSQRDFIDSIISALGFEPQDFWASVFGTYPTGADPSQVAFGTNF